MLEGYKEYKTTNYDWLPQIPSHWEWKYLSQSCNEQKIKNSGNRENCVLSLSYGNIIRKKDINFGLVPKEYSNYQIVNKGNIILRLTDLQNDHTSLRTGLVKEKGIITSAYTCIKPHENSMYLQYLLHSYDTLKLFYGMGGGVRQSIGFKEICNINIPLPPRHEQDQIVRYLDWKVSMINKYINAKKKQIELLKERKQTIINQAVTKGLDINVPMKDSGIEWLGKIPAQWNIRRLKTLTSLSNQKKIGNISQYVGLENIESWTGKHIIIKNIEAQSVCNIFKKGNLLFAKLRPYLAKSWIAEYDGVCSSEFLVMCNIKININYLHSFFKLKSFIFHIDSSTYGAKMPRANWDFIGNCKLPVPPHDEQEKISVFCQENSISIENYCNKLQQQIKILQEYHTRLISDVVTGKVNVQNVKVPEYPEYYTEDNQLQEETKCQ
jgi:type I restriction enzyme, S subunit